MRTRKPPTTTLSSVDRIEGALRGGRFPEALQLALAEPGRLDLLFRAVLGRVRGWRQSGQTGFAADLIRKVWGRVGGDPARAAALAAELAACGFVSEALLIAPDPAPIRTIAADAAVASGPAGRGSLPDELQPAFDALLAAFAAFTAGLDGEARDHLNTISLSSPFAEWKLLLRGLMAWHAGDDARALDNWQRLTPCRLPHEYVLVLRAAIDSAYCHALPPAQQIACARAGDQLLGHPALATIRQFQAALAEAKIADIIRLAQKTVDQLKPIAPEWASCVTEAVAHVITHRGDLRDVEQVARMLPPLPTDPTFDLMRSHVAATLGKPGLARDYILKYESVLATRPEISGTQSRRVRALCWWRAGILARELQDDRAGRFTRRRTTGLTSGPSVEECFRRAEELADDLAVVLQSRFEEALEARDVDAIVAAGEKLLSRRPNDRVTLLQLHQACADAGRAADRLKYADALLAVAPLDGASQRLAGIARRIRCRELAVAGDLPGAQALAQAALSGSAACTAPARVLLAGLAWLAGDTNAGAHHLAQLPATVLEPERALRVIIESTALGLSNKLRIAPNATLKAALNRLLSLDEAMGLAAALVDLHGDALKYRGQKALAKKVQENLLAAAGQPGSTAAQQERAARLAVEAEWHDTAKGLAAIGRRRFPTEPVFEYLSARALINSRDPRKLAKASLHMRRAQECLKALPPERQSASLIQELDGMRRQIEQLRPSDELGSMIEDMARLFGSFATDLDLDCDEVPF